MADRIHASDLLRSPADSHNQFSTKHAEAIARLNEVLSAFQRSNDIGAAFHRGDPGGIETLESLGSISDATVQNIIRTSRDHTLISQLQRTAFLAFAQLIADRVKHTLTPLVEKLDRLISDPNARAHWIHTCATDRTQHHALRQLGIDPNLVEHYVQAPVQYDAKILDALNHSRRTLQSLLHEATLHWHPITSGVLVERYRSFASEILRTLNIQERSFAANAIRSGLSEAKSNEAWNRHIAKGGEIAANVIAFALTGGLSTLVGGLYSAGNAALIGLPDYLGANDAAQKTKQLHALKLVDTQTVSRHQQDAQRARHAYFAGICTALFSSWIGNHVSETISRRSNSNSLMYENSQAIGFAVGTGADELAKTALSH